MANEKKVLDQNGLLYYHSGIKTMFTTDVAWDSTNNKLTKTKNGSTSDVVTAATMKAAMGLDNVGNFKAVSTVANQDLTETEKANARANIGAGSSGFSGNFDDLTNIPTTVAGYGITDLSISSGTITIGSNSFKGVSVAASQGLTTTEQANARTNIGVDITSFTTAVAWDSTNSKITTTKNGSTSDVVTAATLKTAMSLNNVGNFKAVSTVASQGLTDAEKANARANLGIDITQLYKFKGTVATVSALDNIQNPEIGDVYNVTANGKNYAWTGTEWDDLGGEFTIDTITNAEIDVILAS